jgi:hypothetical protein
LPLADRQQELQQVFLHGWRRVTDHAQVN